MADRTSAYSRAGVDYSLLDFGKREAQRFALATAEHLTHRAVREIGESRGESAYVVDVGGTLLATVSEGLGTKSAIADAARSITGRTHYDHIAQDTVATILNDLATVGGAPLAVMAFWAAGKSEWFADAERMGDLARGWARACGMARCAWGGGETQTLVDVVDAESVVLGGSAVAIIRPPERLLSGGRLRPGDAILIAPSSGIHANGVTLIRRLAAQLPEGYRSLVPDDPQRRCLGEVLLDPSPLYGPLVEALQEGGIDLHYAVHLTGHGWRKVMRADRDLSYVVETLPPVPPIFYALQRWGGIDDAEAYATFNMGGGFALFVPSEQAAAAVSVASKRGEQLVHAGVVEGGPRRVVLRPQAITFEKDSLRIR